MTYDLPETCAATYGTNTTHFYIYVQHFHTYFSLNSSLFRYFVISLCVFISLVSNFDVLCDTWHDTYILCPVGRIYVGSCCPKNVVVIVVAYRVSQRSNINKDSCVRDGTEAKRVRSHTPVHVTYNSPPPPLPIHPCAYDDYRAVVLVGMLYFLT